MVLAGSERAGYRRRLVERHSDCRWSNDATGVGRRYFLSKAKGTTAASGADPTAGWQAASLLS